MVISGKKLILPTIFLLLAIFLFISLFIGYNNSQFNDIKEDTFFKPEDTAPKFPGSITIISIGTYNFHPKNITTLRNDIFNEGYFSVFDILAYLSTNNMIDMEYYFDASMNTHIIKTINNLENWWYQAYYDGGWLENNAFRMDHYPYKDNMFIRLIQEQPVRLNQIYSKFNNETARKVYNNGEVIIPYVQITGKTNILIFENVTVTAHNLRNDAFQDGVITAIDVILSLSDQEELTYRIRWFESIGTARIVKSYYIYIINEDAASGRCGFVYETGTRTISGNHIHIPADTRIINSPEYMEWYWICI